MTFSREHITTLKNTPISDYLRSMSIEPVRVSGVQLVYRSPITGESTPSFYVHPQKNVFNCFSSGEKGDIIRLVTLLENLTFRLALERLASFDPEKQSPFFFSGKTSNVGTSIHETTGMTLIDERALFNPILMEYVISRGIPPALAKRYLHEVRYRNGNREYYAVGFKTDKDSYALRSKLFKGWLGQSAIRTIAIPGSTSVDVYEGFFDFLSALTYNRLLRPVTTTVVINSTNNLKHALSAFEGAKAVNCYFDNDNAGRSSMAKLKALALPVRDCSDLYANHNDFNDMLIHTR